MRVFSFSSFSKKEVINCSDGKKLGFVFDLEFDDTGKILNISVKEKKCFSNSQEYVIPWNCIEKIGDDIILVKYEWACFAGQNEKRERKCFF